MPLTPSHVAAVLPARWLGLPLSALAIGSMAPDLPYFLPFVALDGALGGTHTAVGIVGIDLLMGLAAWVVWEGLLAAPATAMAPRWVRARFPEDRPVGLRAALAAPGSGVRLVVALVLGAFTHVTWDSFTHIDAFGATHVAVLRDEAFRGYTGARVEQYVSGVAGLVVLALAVAWWAWRTPPRDVALRPAAWWLAVPPLAATLVGGLAGGLATLSAGDGVRRSVFDAVTGGGGSGAVVSVAVAVLWHLATAVTRSVGSPAGR